VSPDEDRIVPNKTPEQIEFEKMAAEFVAAVQRGDLPTPLPDLDPSLVSPAPKPPAPLGPPAPRSPAVKARVEAMVAYRSGQQKAGVSPATPPPGTTGPKVTPPPPGTKPATTSPMYFDCPICGHPFVDDAYSGGKVICCPQCENEFAAASGLNHRATPQAVETRGFFGQLLWGKSVQTPLRKRLASTIRLYESMASSAAASGNFEQAQFYQMRASDARRQLEAT
jgi:hypothetical protein